MREARARAGHVDSLTAARPGPSVCASTGGGRGGVGGVAKGCCKFATGQPNPHPCSFAQQQGLLGCPQALYHNSPCRGAPGHQLCLLMTSSVQSPWKPKVTKITEAACKSGKSRARADRPASSPGSPTSRHSSLGHMIRPP